MTTSDHLTAEQLFEVVPQCSVSPGPISDHSYVSQAPFSELIDSTYFELHSGKKTSIDDILVVWEIRLSLLLFSDQLPVAKREAVALNNALYLYENPGAPQPNGNTPPQKPPQKVASNGSQNSIGNSKALPVYPLPNNNNGEIKDSLLMLLLNLKSAPNLARVNEIYRLCYQKRLKGENDDGGVSGKGNSLQAKLMALAYEVIAVLFVSRNYTTLVSFLTSLRHDLQGTKSPASGSENTGVDGFYSNVSLMYVLAKIHVRRASQSEPKVWGTLYGEQLSEVVASTWRSLSYVTGKVAPRLHGPLSQITAETQDISVSEIAGLVAKDEISIRTICCLLAFWSIAATHNTCFSETDFTVVPDEGESNLERVHSHITSKWAIFFNKLYGLE